MGPRLPRSATPTFPLGGCEHPTKGNVANDGHPNHQPNARDARESFRELVAIQGARVEPTRRSQARSDKGGEMGDETQDTGQVLPPSRVRTAGESARERGERSGKLVAAALGRLSRGWRPDTGWPERDTTGAWGANDVHVSPDDPCLLHLKRSSSRFVQRIGSAT